MGPEKGLSWRIIGSKYRQKRNEEGSRTTVLKFKHAPKWTGDYGAPLSKPIIWEVWQGTKNFAFLTSSPLILILLVQDLFWKWDSGANPGSTGITWELQQLGKPGSLPWKLWFNGFCRETEYQVFCLYALYFENFKLREKLNAQNNFLKIEQFESNLLIWRPTTPFFRLCIFLQMRTFAYNHNRTIKIRKFMLVPDDHSGFTKCTHNFL